VIDCATAAGGCAAGARLRAQSTSPISARWLAAAGGTARQSIACRTITSPSGAIMKAKSRCPAGVVAKPPAEYTRPLTGLRVKPLGLPIPYAPAAGFALGWPVAYSPKGYWANLAHCYGSVGVGRGPVSRHRHRRRALCGDRPRPAPPRPQHRGRRARRRGYRPAKLAAARHRGPGFYKERSQDVPITAARLASEIPAAERPAFEYLDTGSASFANYLRVRANRRDDFYIRPPAASICATCRCRCGARCASRPVSRA
jgi:hypothetical protein